MSASFLSVAEAVGREARPQLRREEVRVVFGGSISSATRVLEKKVTENHQWKTGLKQSGSESET